VNIILRVIEKDSGKEIFIDDKLNIYTKDDFVSLIKQNKINNLILAKRNNKVFIKSKPNTNKIDNIAFNTISQKELISFYKNYYQVIIRGKLKQYENIRRKQPKKRILVKDDKGDFFSTKTEEDIRNHLKKHKIIILKAANGQKINSLILGAILIDEYCRMGWDDWIDWLGAFNIKDTSVGIAQIKLSTAREIIKKQYYNPAPGKITSQSSSLQIWYYLNQPEPSIQFAAAAIKLSIEYWRKKKIDISKQNNVLAYLYHSGYTKNINKATTKRCIQVSSEFYQIAKLILL